MNIFNKRTLRGDIFGGITAGVVALPLALAFGEQSGLGAAAGLYGAAFIAFFAAMLGGTNTQISGPTAPMTALSMVVIAGLLQAAEGRVEAALPLILLVFLLSGLIQVALGVIKIGSYIKYIPYTVVSGFMTGIGVIILITQIPPAIGYYAAEHEELVEQFMPHAEELILDRIAKEEAEHGVLILEHMEDAVERAQEITPEHIEEEAVILVANDSKGVIGSLKYLPHAMSKINWIELLLALSTIFIIYGFKRITRVVPSTLIALLAVSGVAYFMQIDYVQIREIPSGYPILHFEIFAGLDFWAVAPYLVSALLLALLGSIDSLLTSVVADNLTKTQHKPNKELIGQGIGNSIAALFGGIPGAGATIRTVVNIQAGGRTKLSGMVSGVLLFIILLFLGPIASKIPAAVLAGILVTVGIGVMDYKGLRAFPKMETSAKVILITVLVLTVFWQLVYAVGVGLVMASIVFLKKMSDESHRRTVITNLGKNMGTGALWEDELTIPESIREKVIFKHLSGPMFFGFATYFKSMVNKLGSIHILVIRMEDVPFIDQSGLYALEDSIEALQKQGVVVALSGLNEQGMKQAKNMKLVPHLVSERHVFAHFDDCKVWLREVVQSEEKMNAEIALLNPAAT